MKSFGSNMEWPPTDKDKCSGEGRDEKSWTVEEISALNQQALDGNSHSQYILGKMYETGKSVERNVDTAIKWLSMASEQGNEAAQYEMGKLMLEGYEKNPDPHSVLYCKTSDSVKNIKTNKQRAQEYFLQAASSGHYEALQVLLDWANQGDSYLQMQIGKMCLDGIIDGGDNAAIKWLRHSSANGEKLATIMLGELYLDGRISCFENNEIIDWLRHIDRVAAWYRMGLVIFSEAKNAADKCNAAKYIYLAAQDGHAAAIKWVRDNMDRDIYRKLVNVMPGEASREWHSENCRDSGFWVGPDELGHDENGQDTWSWVPGR